MAQMSFVSWCIVSLNEIVEKRLADGLVRQELTKSTLGEAMAKLVSEKKEIREFSK